MTYDNDWKDIGDQRDQYGGVYWLYEAPDGTRICVQDPQWESDNDDEGYVYYVPSWWTLTIIEPEGERPLTDDERDEYHDDLRSIVREGLNSSYSGI